MKSLYTLSMPIIKGYSRKAAFLLLIVFMAAVMLGDNAAAQTPTGPVGEVEGNFSVDLLGRANYSIPINVTPGSGGMQPTVSINYNSGGRDGILGVGFSLGGFSAITRGGTNLSNSNAIRPVTYTDKDNLYLDGNLLVLVNGIAFTNGAEYRTEKETFSKIIFFTEGQATYFKVWNRDGTEYEYGRQDASRIEAQGSATKVAAWVLTKATDLEGNYMTYDYYEDNANGFYCPTQIAYTGNNYTGTPTYAAVQFEYVNKTGVITHWTAGSITSITHLLNKIKIFKEGRIIKTYELQYQDADSYAFSNGDKAHLYSVKECGNDGVCLEPTRFNWYNASVNIPSQPVATYDGSPNAGFNYSDWNNGDGTTPSNMADMNGDGKEDLVVFSSLGVYIAYAQGGEGNAGFTSPELKLSEFGNYQGWGTNKRFVGDVNGDGLGDIVAVRNGGFSVALNDGNNNYQNISDYNFSDYSDYHYERLADLNGDGRADMLSIRNDGVYTSLSQGSFFEPWKKGIGQFAGWGVFAPFDLADVNGDGLPDLIGFDNDTDLAWIGLAKGDGTYAEAFHGTENYNGHRNGFNIGNPNTPTKMGDVNGDNLADIVSFTRDGVFVALAKGDGYFLDGELKLNDFRSDGQPEPWDHSQKICYVEDMDGDGMDDILGLGDNWLYFYKASGNGNFTHYADFSYFRRAEGWNTGGSQKVTFAADIDGNGAKEIIGLDHNQIWGTLSVSSRKFIKRIKEGLGKTIMIAYKPLADPAVYQKQPLSPVSYPNVNITPRIHVVSSIDISNGLLDEYSYSEGLNTTQKKYRGFVGDFIRGGGGFSSIETSDWARGIVHTDNFNTSDYHYRNIISNSLTWSTFSGVILSRVVNTPDMYTYNDQVLPSNGGDGGGGNGGGGDGGGGDGGGGDPTCPLCAIPKAGKNSVKGHRPQTLESSQAVAVTRWFPYIKTVEDWKYGTSGEERAFQKTTNEFDNTGNLLKQTVFHPGDFYSVSTNTYENNTGRWILGIIRTNEVKNAVPNKPEITRTTLYDYYPESKRVHQVTENPSTALQLDKVFTYDVFGNVKTIATTGNNGWSGTETRTESFDYDYYGRFKTGQTNAAGHVEQLAYDNDFGQPSFVTDINNLSTSFTYDSFGRLETKTGPDNNVGRQSFAWCNGGNAPINAIYQISYSAADGLPPLTEYYDVLKRKLRTEKTGFDGRKIFTDILYNAKGQAEKNSLPYYQGESPVWIEITYDDLDRVTSVYTPSRGTERTGYYGLFTSVYNVLDQLTTKEYNYMGQLVKSTDNAGKFITYEYDANGNLSKTKDVTDNETVMRYDLNNNKIYMWDADTKEHKYYYNAFREMYQTTNNAGQNVIYNFDKLGRTTLMSEWEGTSIFTYDIGNKAKGKLSSLTGTHGYAEQYTYDDLGRMVSTYYTLAENSGNATISQTYDQFNRPSTLTYPSNFTVKNEYTSTGYLHKVRGLNDGVDYYTANDYNAFGQSKRFTYGNGITTENNYDALGQLRGTRAGRNADGSVQNVSYDYNELGNLKNRKDYRRGLTEDLFFDGLNRLRDANVQTLNGVALSSLHMDYDDGGNIMYKSDIGSYEYNWQNNAGPHALNRTPQGNYSYDTKGNLLSSPTYSAQYTSFDLPWYLNNGNKIFHNIYTPSHTKTTEYEFTQDYQFRKIKIYIGGLNEYESNGYVSTNKHFILAGDQVVAMHTISDNPAIPTETVYFHKDHLGSNSEITDANGNIKESFSYDAWGKPRNPDNWTATTATPSFFRIGYTGHEDLQDMGLVDMGGRIYDPSIGRFLIADPFVQAPENTQSFNRYSYVFNDPLSNVDPSGFDGEGAGGGDGDGERGDHGGDDGGVGGGDDAQVSDAPSTPDIPSQSTTPCGCSDPTQAAIDALGDLARNVTNVSTSYDAATNTTNITVTVTLSRSAMGPQQSESQSAIAPGKEARSQNNQPSLGLSLTPVIGTLAWADYHFRNGNPVMGLALSAFAGFEVATFGGASVLGTFAKGSAIALGKLAFGPIGQRALWTQLAEQGGAAVAKAEALARGLTTLNMTPLGKTLQVMDNGLTKIGLQSVMVPLWNAASTAFVKTAGSEIVVFLRSQNGVTKLGETFVEHEFPFLGDRTLTPIVIKP